jgi:exosome complex component RRP4
MGELLVKDKEIVVPGDILATGMDFIPDFGAYRNNDAVIASRLGVATVNGRAIRIIPLSGKYNPRTEDIIIGKVIDITFSGWRIDTNSAYSAMLSTKDATTRFVGRGSDLTRFLNLGDYVVAKIITVTSQKLIDLTMKAPGLKKLGEGRIISVNPNKVPRIIGKNGSMVSLIKEATGCFIIVGQNGLVWISGQPDKELIAVNTIQMIEKNAHISGLTEKVSEYLSKVK